MKQQEILDYNKRCAEFLGLKRGWWIHQEKPLTEDKKQWWDIDDKTFLGTTIYYDKDLKFYSDWNWIMEVVEAIEKLKDEQGYRWRVDIYVESCQIMNTHNFNGDLIYNKTSKKEAVVQAIDSFLKFYNKNLEI